MAVIPPLPDTERRSPYEPVASTGPFDVTFALYGTGTDYQNWVEVWLNGEKLTPVAQWTLDLESGSLSTAARPITNARVTLATAATGDLVIVGAERPRRTSQFSEGVGVSARHQNVALSGIVAKQRESWDRFSRTIQVPPGDTVAVLPNDRALTVIGFDAAKALALFTMAAGASTIIVKVSTLAALQVAAPSDTGVLLAGRWAENDGGGGLYVWDAANVSADVTADPDWTRLVPPASDLTGASGAWRLVVPAAITKNTSFTIAPSGGNFTEPGAFTEWLAPRRIAPGVTVTVSIADGEYACTKTIRGHVDGHRVVWTNSGLNGAALTGADFAALDAIWVIDPITGQDPWDPLESTCRHASLSIL